jgi:hypothetical protein
MIRAVFVGRVRYDRSFYASTGSGLHIEIKVRRWHPVL